jgi:predicted branched-subunit amino acid permease
MVMGIIAANPAPTPLTLDGFRRGFLAALPFLISNGISGIVIGVAYRGLGLDLPMAALFSIAVYSGTAQAVILGMWPTAPSLTAMMVACVATNARYLFMGAHLRHLFDAVPRRRMLPILYFLADASWFMTVAEAGLGRRDPAYLLGCSVPMVMGWVGGTVFGYLLPMKPQGALAVAATFLPLGFIVTLLPTQWRGPRSWLPWTVSAVVAVAVAIKLGPTWSMLVGGLAGTTISLARNDAD